MSWGGRVPVTRKRKDHISHTKTVVDMWSFQGGHPFFQGSWNITKQCIVIFGISFQITIYCLIPQKWVPFNDLFSLGGGRNGSYLKSRCRVVCLDSLCFFSSQTISHKKETTSLWLYTYIYIYYNVPYSNYNIWYTMYPYILIGILWIQKHRLPTFQTQPSI